MMKASVFLLVFATVGALVAATASAGESGDGLLLKYEWLPGRAYTYETVLAGTNGAERPSHETVIEPLFKKGSLTHLAVSSPALSDNVLFVPVADNGAIGGNPKVGGDAMPPRERANDARSFITRALRVTQLYRENEWGFPTRPLDHQSDTTWNDFTFRLADTFDAESTKPVSLRIVDKTGKLQFRRFDRIKGMLLEQRCRLGDVDLVTRLRNVKDMDSADTKKRERQMASAIDENAFRLHVCQPFLDSQDSVVKKTAFLGIFSITEETHLGRAYPDIAKAAGSDPYFLMLADSLIYKHLESGALWAVDVITNEKWRDGEDRHVLFVTTKLEELSGLDFGRDHGKWSQWIKRVHPVFQELAKTKTSVVIPQLDHKDPWVRLFALKQLSERSDVDLEPILDKAKADPDEKVKAFATATLKKLKKKEKK